MYWTQNENLFEFRLLNRQGAYRDGYTKYTRICRDSLMPDHWYDLHRSIMVRIKTGSPAKRSDIFVNCKDSGERKDCRNQKLKKVA
jgi:hypothetical protein